jgi:2-methylcitrate dehydratase PrpD
VHSLVLELTGKKEPADGLQGKFSVYHGCAAGLIFGRAGEEEFADDIVNRPDVVALRRKVVATVDDSIDEASADVTAVLPTAAASTCSSSTRSARCSAR